MQLKSLELSGFKSFPDKTVIEFNKGLTAVVGPNGSGKSNISDAIRWVLGEQSTKSLRGAKMEDVIFSGTQSRGASGSATVVLNFDNADRQFAVDADTVSIKRKYYRSGDSEYYINEKQMRLRDINELLMDSGVGKEGFAVVGQGKIADIISSKSGDRREFFETAAGITKYRYRKEEALKDLKNAAENMVRLTDILGELEVRLEPLKEQSEKAIEFTKLSNEHKDLDVFISVDLIKTTNERVLSSKAKLSEVKSEYDDYAQKANALEEQITKTYDTMQKLQVDIYNYDQEKERLSAENAQLLSDIAVAENNILHETKNAQGIKESIVSLKLQGEGFTNTLASRESEIEQLKQKGILLEQQLTELISQQDNLSQSISQTELDSIELDRKINEYKVTLSQIQYMITAKTQKSEQLAEVVQSIGQSIAANEQSAAMLSKDKEDANEAVMMVKEKLLSIDNVILGFNVKKDKRVSYAKERSEELSNTYLSIKEKSNRLRMLSDMNDSLEGFSKTVKEVIKADKTKALSGIIGTVSQLVSVKAEHAVAIETAVGYGMQNVVVADEFAAKQAISYLAKNKLGRATFMPLTSVKGSRYYDKELPNQTGFIGIGSDLVTFDKRYQNIIDFLLGRIVIVDNLDNGTLIAKRYQYKFRIVTLDGQVINAGGTFTGGSQDRGFAPLSRLVTIERYTTEIAQLQQKLTELKTVVNSSKQAIIEIEDEIQKQNDLKVICNNDLVNFTSEYHRLELAVDNANEVVRRSKEEREAAKAELLAIEPEIEELRADEIRCSKKLQDSQGEKEQRAQLSLSVSKQAGELVSEITAKTVAKSECEKDLSVALKAIEDLNRSSEEIKLKTQTLEGELLTVIQRIDSLKVSVEQNKVIIEQTKQAVKDLDDRRQQAIVKRQELEQSTTKLRADEKEQSMLKEGLVSQISRIEEQVISLSKEVDICIAKLWDEYQLTRSEAFAMDFSRLDVATAKIRISALRQQIKALGQVNVAAIVEYEEVKERYDFLNKQLKDVTNSTKELEKIIQELTDRMERDFSDTFRDINNNFKRIFAELFGGGTASLTLTDPDNVLESGIDIYVSPPGKIVKSLSLLSGGEQAFIAIAIYFALLTVKPSPFCVLDEIEAALDEVNVSKYARYLKLLSANTQFILITHRRGTMEEADTMYGVTMQNEGVSKILKLDHN